MKSLIKCLILLCLGLAVGCSSAVEPTDNRAASSNQAVETARLELTTDVLADTDLGGVRFTVTQVDCTTGDPIVPGYTETADVDLADMFIPGGNGTFEDAPYDADSQHLFADQYFDLQPGCYDVLVEPIQEDGTLSRDCWSAHQDAVEVFASSTTEIFLIMQCRGDNGGGLDIIASANHPPRIDDLQFEPSKFTCEEITEVCITISDPDSDPMDVVWTTSSTDAQVISTGTYTDADGVITACATIQSTTPGTYDIKALVYDMGYDANGDLVTIEELLVTQGDPHPSHAAIKFPIHVLEPESCIETCECPEGFDVSEDGDSCIYLDVVNATFNGTTYQVCEGDQNNGYSARGALYPNGLQEPNAFFGQTWTPIDGRLNDVGVWACNPPGTVGATQPVDEWIGFTTCIDVPADGQYIVGIGADNRVRFSIDGNLEFILNNDDEENFEHWWMRRVNLTAGTHIIELEGYNDGGDAAFGADIYGPFPAGSLSTDADMAAADSEGNIIFSTGNMIGESFDLGQFSGYSCPDGYAVNMCGAAPTCSMLIEKECIDL